MKKSFFLIFAMAGLLFLSARVMGQTNPVSSDLYTPYNFYYKNLPQTIARMRTPALWAQTMAGLKRNAALLKEEQAPAYHIKILHGSQKILDDEAIFTKRRNGVFIIGKLYFSKNGADTSLSINLVGTAFAVSDDGICVTNHHVFDGLFQPGNQSKRDSVFFILTTTNKFYLLSNLLAFSQNNDLAVFKVESRGDRFAAIPFGRPAHVGAAAFCISNPRGHFYSFSKGLVAKNVGIDSFEVPGAGYSKNGRPPIRMEITADYGVGSSGGPILDKYGNLIGVVVSTYPIVGIGKDGLGKDFAYIQMVVKDTSPVLALSELLENKTF